MFFRGVSSFELSGLKPYSLYEIKIAVQDQNNRKSEFSQKIQIRTLQGGILYKIKSTGLLYFYIYKINYFLLFSSWYSRTNRIAVDKY